MKTIKLKIVNNIDLNYELKTYNSIVHYAYNRFHDNPSLKEKDIRGLTNDLFKGQINSWLLQCGIKEAIQIQKRNKEKKVIFGGKYNLKRYLKHSITKEEYKTNKLLPISSQGEKLKGGNRLFEFHFDERYIIFKFSKQKHIKIELPKFRKDYINEFIKVQNLIDTHQITISIKLNSKFIYLTYDETLLKDINKIVYLKENRILGIDLNPNYIGLSILEFDKNNNFKILHKQIFDLNLLNIKSNESSNSKKSKYIANKRKYELIKICYQIKNQAIYWKCGKLAIEDLSINSSDKEKGIAFNRLCNNVWLRNLIANKLTMLANIYGFELVKVNPAYSSFIGNMLYGNDNTPDMVASSIEIARRGFKKYKKNWFYPKFDKEIIDEQWKQTLDGIENWKDWFNKIKNLELKYRVLLNDCINNAVFSKFNIKSKVGLYFFE
jgi:hypothetical protein